MFNYDKVVKRRLCLGRVSSLGWPFPAKHLILKGHIWETKLIFCSRSPSIRKSSTLSEI